MVGKANMCHNTQIKQIKHINQSDCTRTVTVWKIMAKNERSIYYQAIVKMIKIFGLPYKGVYSACTILANKMKFSKSPHNIYTFFSLYNRLVQSFIHNIVIVEMKHQQSETHDNSKNRNHLKRQHTTMLSKPS